MLRCVTSRNNILWWYFLHRCRNWGILRAFCWRVWWKPRKSSEYIAAALSTWRRHGWQDGSRWLQPQADCARHNCTNVWTSSSNCTAVPLTAWDRIKPVFLLLLSSFHFFPCSLSFILRLSILFHLSHVHQLLTFISPFLPIQFLLIGAVSCVHSFFISARLSLFLSFHSSNRSHFLPFLYKFSAFSRFFPPFLPSVAHITYSLPLFHAFLFLYLFTLVRHYSCFPSFDTNNFLPFPFNSFVT